MILTAAWSTAGASWSRSDSLALWALLAGIVGIAVAVHTLMRGNRNSSVASMIPLNAEIRDMYDAYVDSFSSARFHMQIELEILERKITTRLEKLMNVLEMSAAIQIEGTFSGVSRVLMRDYLQRILEDLLIDDYTSNNVSRLLQDQQTYIYIRRFLRRKARLSITLPPEWFLAPDQTRWQRIRQHLHF
jgi:hypothetical protein